MFEKMISGDQPKTENQSVTMVTETDHVTNESGSKNKEDTGQKGELFYLFMQWIPRLKCFIPCKEIILYIIKN